MGGDITFDQPAGGRPRLEDGLDGVMVSLNSAGMEFVPLAEVSHRQRIVPLDCDTMLTARDMLISFGD